MGSQVLTRLSTFRHLALAAGLVCSAVTLSPTRAQEEGSKGIKSEEVVPRTKGRAGGPAKQGARRKRTYTSNVKRAASPPPKGEEDVRVGLTIVRYEPRGAVYRPGGEGTKDILMEGTEEVPTPPNKVTDWEGTDWTRAIPDEQFAVGQAVRLHLEPLTGDGYLYIVHQELYADGTAGPARLLFPTLRTSSGNNLVRPNTDIWIPRAPAYFRIRPSESNKKHVGELLTVVLRPEAPRDLLRRAIEDQPLALSVDELGRLFAGAKGAAIRMNLDDGQGQKQTASELSKDIGMEGQEATLQDDDALPQTIYETRRRSGQPVIIPISLKFKVE